MKEKQKSCEHKVHKKIENGTEWEINSSKNKSIVIKRNVLEVEKGLSYRIEV